MNARRRFVVSFAYIVKPDTITRNINKRTDVHISVEKEKKSDKKT
jgi:hypothetical protein